MTRDRPIPSAILPYQTCLAQVNLARPIPRVASPHHLKRKACPWTQCRNSLAQRLAEDIPRDDVTLHFARAFTDAAYQHIAIPAFEREVFRHAVAAVDLHAAIDHAARTFRGDELGHCGLLAEILAAFR